MTRPADSNREEALFNAAMEIANPAERTRYLLEACGDDAELRTRVERLIEVSERVDGYFPEDELEEAGNPELSPVGEKPGDIIGRYKLLEKIGEGGFGVVFMAEQQEPVRRRVALKVIKLGMDTRQVIARFEAERQALALMDHPHIAQVFDAGATQTGRPYFVMELVRGIPITEFCDNNKLTLEERLQLLIPVCQAIQSAHQKGIIHRDIKPTNILVTLHHGDPMAKVIDFGVAKATNQQLTEKTLFTRFTQMIGTPAYMSPEQASLSTDVDTRTDIYSLGVVLYELLTGTTPFDAKELASAGYDEMRRIIRETEPERPSTRLTRERLAKRSVSPDKSEIRNHNSEIAKDLDWVVMKALEKDPTRRYESANGLAADLKRYLNREPVSAAAPTFAYQLLKFSQKHRKTFVAAAVLAVILVIATVVSSWQAIRATQAQRAADQQRELAGEQSAEARRQTEVAEAVIDFLVRDLLQQGNPMSPGGAATTNLTLYEAIRFAMEKVEERFSDKPAVEASIRSVLGQVLSFSGDAIEAEEQLRSAVRLFDQAHANDDPRRLVAMRWLGWSLSFHATPNKSVEGEHLLEEAYAQQVRVLGTTNEQTLVTMLFLGMHHVNNNQLERAEELFRRGVLLTAGYSDQPGRLDIQFKYGLACVFQRQSRHLEARGLYKLVLEAFRKSSAPGAPIANVMWSLGDYSSWWDGEHEQAAAMLEEGLALSRSASGNGYPTLEILGALSEVRLRQNRFVEAIDLNRQQMNGFAERVGPGHLRTATHGCRLAAIIGRHGDWQAAVQELAAQRQRDINHSQTLAWELMMRHLAGSSDLAPELRQTIWQNVSENPQEAAAYDTALFLLTLPCPEAELPNAIALGELAATFPAGYPEWKHVKSPLLQGLTAFRQGDLEKAIQYFDQPEDRRSHWPIVALVQFFKSMALRQLGQTTEAKATLEQANELLSLLLAAGDLDRFPDGDELFTAYAACLVAREQAETAVLGHLKSPTVTVETLADARESWGPVAELLRQADQAGRKRDYGTARQRYLDAMELKRFNWPAGFQKHLDLDQRMAVAFILSGDLDSYARLCGLDPYPTIAGARVVSDRTMLLHPGAPHLTGDLPEAKTDATEPDYWALDLRGRRLLRAERYEEASAVFRVLTGWKRETRALQASAMAAIAAHHLGQVKEARSFLAQAEVGLHNILELNEGHYGPDWHQEATIELLLKEARGLIGDEILAH